MSEEKIKVSPDELANFCVELAESRKAENINLVKVGEVSLIADYFLICTGNSQPHLTALAEFFRRKVREKYDVRPLSIEGKAVSQWIVIDFGSVIIHVLTPEIREKYQLENLWGDATKIEKILADRNTNIES